MQDAHILVIGSTGKTGSRVLKTLTGKGYKVRAGSRNSAIPFDWDRPGTWAPALAGIKAAYVSYFPDLAFPGAADKIEALTRAAGTSGVKKLVLLSGRGEAHARHCEDIVRHSGLDFILVRAAWFAQNFSEGYLQPAVLEGMVALPAGQIKEPLVDVDDIADVAVAALTEDRHNGELYEVTGPRLLSFAEAAAEISAAAGIPVRYQPITLDQFHAGMLAIAGADMAGLFTEICRETLDGRNAWLADGVQRALGREPRDFADFCRNAAVGGVWRKAA
ncbi:MAG: NAD(P)H-binding protein [Hoeflea sp.]|uniref:NAD(P)H-binding protein n=1 Tax=Hoeflea sp. TaxID=1940281 RepID=UPI00272F64C8|nr:NAD(P)H-binding protein [Hoeflea sp.]MDP2121354.1 NAD(P)H-binding protein [Hoeflea sp.]